MQPAAVLRCLATVIGLSAAVGARAEESTLRKVSEAVHGPPAERPSNERPRAEHPAEHLSAVSDHGDSDFWSGLFMEVFASGDDQERGSYVAARWPYAFGHSGGLVHCEAGSERDPTRTPARPSALALRVGVDGARIEDDLVRVGLDLRLELPLRFTLEARGSRYRERVDGDDLDLDAWELAATWRLLQFSNLAVRIGGGALGVHDKGGSAYGAEAIAALDIQPVAPLLIAARAASGTVGSASHRELRIETGAIWNRVEAAVGWEQVASGTVRLDGPYIALRTWF